jgi:hypothetical protein
METLTVSAKVTLPESFTQAELTAVYTALSIPVTALITRDRNLMSMVIEWDLDVIVLNG